jgi:hypothetical protein
MHHAMNSAFHSLVVSIYHFTMDIQILTNAN